MIPLAKLEPDCFYWATRKSDRYAPVQVVQVSTVFGSEPEYWTVACMGSDQHQMPAEFEFVARIVPPSSKQAISLAAE